MGRCKAALQQNQTGVRSGAGRGSRANSKSAPRSRSAPFHVRRSQGRGRREALRGRVCGAEAAAPNGGTLRVRGDSPLRRGGTVGSPGRTSVLDVTPPRAGGPGRPAVTRPRGAGSPAAAPRLRVHTAGRRTRHSPWEGHVGAGAPRRKEVTSLLGSTSPKRLRSVGQSRLQPPGRKNIKTPGGHKSWGKGDPQVTGTQSSHTGGSGCLSPTRGLNTEHALTSASFETALGLGTRPSRARPRKTHPTPRAGGARVLGCLARALEGQPPGLPWGAGRAGLGGTSGQGPAASANVARAVTWPWRAAAWAPMGPSGAKLPTDGSCPFRDVALAAVT